MPGLTELPAVKSTMPILWQAALQDAVVSADWSPDGTWLAAAIADGTIVLFDAATGSKLRSGSAHRTGATKVAWHPSDDIFISAGQDGRAILWTTKSDEPVASLQCGMGWVEHVAWSPSGNLVATACGRSLKLWSKSGQLLRDFALQPNTIAGLAWSSDSRQLVTACYGQVVFWSPHNSEPQRTFHWKGSMVSLAWSPDGKYLCHGNQDSTVHVWLVATAKELQMTGYPMKVGQLSWDRSSKYLATGGSPQVTVWNCAGRGPSGTKPITLSFHLDALTALHFQPNGPLLASGCARGDVAIWMVGKASEPVAAAALSSPITSLAWAKSAKRIAACAEDGSLVMFDLGGIKSP